MLYHIVLVAPRADLTETEREGFAAALERAAREIPTVRAVRVGRRIRHGQGYEAMMPADFAFAAVLEFDDLAGLQAYLGHPAHADLGARFNDSLASALVCDCEMGDVADVRGWLGL